SAWALTCTCAESHGVSSPFVQMNSVFAKGGMASPGGRTASVDPGEYAPRGSGTARRDHWQFSAPRAKIGEQSAAAGNSILFAHPACDKSSSGLPSTSAAFRPQGW